jgi:hypothetical protein
MTATRLILCVTLAVLLGSPAFPVPLLAHPVVPPAPLAQPSASPLARLPLAFEPNAGQADPAAQFFVRAPGGLLFFGQDGVTLALGAGERPDEGQALRWQFVGASPQARLAGAERLPGHASYFRGNDPSRWQVGLPLYGAVRYQGLYPGIDLGYDGITRQLKGTFTIAPGADPAHIRWRYTGARRVTVNAQGALLVELPSGSQATEQAPVAWQQRGGVRRPVDARYAIHADNTLGFAVGGYDPTLPLIIDPILTYSTYLGGSMSDAIYSIAVDAAGNIYVTGYTYSPDFPLRDPVQPTPHGSMEVFVSKLDPSGATLLFSTYLGGHSSDNGNGIYVNSFGNVFVTGSTASVDFPVVNPLQPNLRGITNAFIAQLDSTGTSLVYSTYLGGSGDPGNGNGDIGNAIVVDQAGRMYVVGNAASPDFPLVNPYQSQRRGLYDAFIVRLSSDGSALEYSTYFGGNDWDLGLRFQLDDSGNMYLTGLTNSSDFPVVNAVQSVYGGAGDAYVSKLNPQGTALIYSTYLGGSRLDWGLDLALGDQDDVFATGFTASPDFPLADPYQSTLNGSEDAYVSHLSTTGSVLIYSTFLGGGDIEEARGIRVDRDGRAWVMGKTYSTDFPTVRPLQPSLLGADDNFISQFTLNGDNLLFSTYLGGSDGENPYAMVIDRNDSIYISGLTHSTDFPLCDPFQPAFGGGLYDAFVSKFYTSDIAYPPTPTPTTTITPTPMVTATATPLPPTPTATSNIQHVYAPGVFYNAAQP